MSNPHPDPELPLAGRELDRQALDEHEARAQMRLEQAVETAIEARGRVELSMTA